VKTPRPRTPDWSLDGELRKAKARGLSGDGVEPPPPAPRPELPGPGVLIDSLCGLVCPACGGEKRTRNTLCYSCFKSLDRSGQHALWRLIGRGYEEALSDALASLRVTAPHWPAGGSS
jgi:hypothetical protein